MLTTRFNNRNYRLPDFIIPGAAKSGTTTLYQLLSQHPDLFFPKSRKEPFYFSFGGQKPQYADEEFNRIPIWDTQEYLNLFLEAKSDQLCGDASTSYLYTADKSIELMKEAYGAGFSRIKVIILLRNPIDRAYSHYTYLIRNGYENRSFEEAISPEGISEWKRKRWGFDYLKYGEYADQVAAYKTALPQTKIWLMEDLKQGDSMLREIFRYLEVPEMEVKSNVKANPSGIPKNRGMVNLLRKNPVLQAIGKKLPEGLQHSLKRKRDNVMSKLLEKKPMQEDTRLKLVEYYREDIEKLQEVIGRDLSHWLITDPTSEGGKKD